MLAMAMAMASTGHAPGLPEAMAKAAFLAPEG